MKARSSEQKKQQKKREEKRKVLLSVKFIVRADSTETLPLRNPFASLKATITKTGGGRKKS